MTIAIESANPTKTKKKKKGPLLASLFGSFGLGVFWYAWGKVGFWWALAYGIFWVPWLGYRVAELMKLGQVGG